MKKSRPKWGFHSSKPSKSGTCAPKISEIYETLSDPQWFTPVDASQAYHQIPLATEKDRDLTSFVTPDGGLYRYKYMPFGLKNTCACWSRFIDGAVTRLLVKTGDTARACGNLTVPGVVFGGPPLSKKLVDCRLSHGPGLGGPP